MSKQNKDQVKDKHLQRTYGINLQEWKKISENGCEICGTKEGRICMDHIHVAGFKKMSAEEKRKYVRGALCFLCNTGIKGFDKTKDGTKNRIRLEGTYKYFLKYKLKGEI